MSDLMGLAFIMTGLVLYRFYGELSNALHRCVQGLKYQSLLRSIETLRRRCYRKPSVEDEDLERRVSRLRRCKLHVACLNNVSRTKL
jgi:hypothetical protein